MLLDACRPPGRPGAASACVHLDRSFVQQADAGLEFVKRYDESRSAWDASVDVGMDWNPEPWLRFGMVGFGYTM